MRQSRFLGPAAALTIFLAPCGAAGNERHFTYTYESDVLSPGQLELEPWSTFRGGRGDFYTAFDQRLEFEAGIAKALQAALYWNMTAVAEDVTLIDASGATSDTRRQSFSFTGISSELKYQVMDPVADALGFALYFEGAAGPVEAEVEAKLIFDKRLGKALLAANLVGAHEWQFGEETGREVELEVDLAGGFFLGDAFMLGVELRNQIDLENGNEFESSAFFGGPAVAYAQQSWWIALTILPQFAAIKRKSEEIEPGPVVPEPDDSSLNLHEHERVEVRLLAGFHL